MKGEGEELISSYLEKTKERKKERRKKERKKERTNIQLPGENESGEKSRWVFLKRQIGGDLRLKFKGCLT